MRVSLAVAAALVLPLSAELNGDKRFVTRRSDVYADLLGETTRTWDAILVDVDHALPRDLLGVEAQHAKELGRPEDLVLGYLPHPGAHMGHLFGLGQTRLAFGQGFEIGLEIEGHGASVAGQPTRETVEVWEHRAPIRCAAA